MSAPIAFRVFGTPAPQGSKAGFVNKSTGRVSMVESSAKVKPWRQDVKYAALEALRVGPEDEQGMAERIGNYFPRGVAVRVTLSFLLARPKSHYRTGANAHLLRDGAPLYPPTKPDIDKLLRSTLDALGEAGVWYDDAQVADVVMWKRYATGEQPGASIDIREVTP